MKPIGEPASPSQGASLEELPLVRHYTYDTIYPRETFL